MIIYSKGGAKLEVSLKEFPGIFPDSQSELSRQKKGRPEPLFSFSFESGPFQRLLLSVSVRAITIPTTAIISTENTISNAANAKTNSPGDGRRWACG
ncbi:MAG: hypothetical protein QOG23_248 [Blastocatellia bacterium]|jgi:hypothetical protein|nr:hypothetical protein [Blastocatellia bacterium]